MRFGTSWEKASQEKSGGAAGTFISYPAKSGGTTIRILDEPDKWEAYWEHFDPTQQKSYPCTGDRDSCPGCTSPNERVKKATRRIVFNVVISKGENTYVNLFKVTRGVAEKLEARAKKYETIRDRDYTITRLEGSGFVDYDVEAEDKNVQDLTAYDAKRKNVEQALQDAYNDVFGESPQERAAAPKADSTPAAQETGSTDKDSEIERLKRQLAAKEAELAKNPPTEPEAEQEAVAEGEEEDPGEPNVTLEDLAAMTKAAVLQLIKSEQKWGRLPDEDVSKLTKDKLIDWIKANA